VAEHLYRATVRWTGDLGSGTREYGGYSREHVIEVEGKPPIPASSGMSTRGDRSKHDPEDLLLSALSSCHMLWYLHLCSEAGVVVTGYTDHAEAVLETTRDGGGRITRATLHPRVRVSEGSLEAARDLHEAAHQKCFIANSVNFPVRCEPTIEGPPSTL
jgi:organic hydroperoxide reductase OsmC/OhrA